MAGSVCWFNVSGKCLKRNESRAPDVRGPTQKKELLARGAALFWTPTPAPPVCMMAVLLALH